MKWRWSSELEQPLHVLNFHTHLLRLLLHHRYIHRYIHRHIRMSVSIRSSVGAISDPSMKTTLYKMTHFLKRTQLQVWHILNERSWSYLYTHTHTCKAWEEEVMDKYEVVKDLGAGNFGVARLLRHKETKELVAMKYIERGRKVWSFSSLVSQKKFWSFFDWLEIRWKSSTFGIIEDCDLMVICWIADWWECGKRDYQS